MEGFPYKIMKPIILYYKTYTHTQTHTHTLHHNLNNMPMTKESINQDQNGEPEIDHTVYGDIMHVKGGFQIPRCKGQFLWQMTQGYRLARGMEVNTRSPTSHRKQK